MNRLQNILDIRVRAPSQRTDRKSVTTVTVAVAEDDVACRTAKHHAIIAVVNYVVLK